MDADLAILLDAHARTIEEHTLRDINQTRAVVAITESLPIVLRALARLLERG